MVHLTLANLSEDGTRLLLVDDQGREFTLDVDATLRAALRGDDSRLGTLEIQMESALRPRDIQQRIRAGESPEAVAAAAQTTLDKIMSYVGPVLAERAHIAERAQKASVRKVSDAGSTGVARTLGEAVAARLSDAPIANQDLEWDSFRREDGRWTVTATWSKQAPKPVAATTTTDKSSGEARFSYDHRGNFVVADNDDAQWLVGGGQTSDETDVAFEVDGDTPRRLSAVTTPSGDLDSSGLGDDAIELVAPVSPAPAPEVVKRPARRRRRRAQGEEQGFFDAVFARAQSDTGTESDTRRGRELPADEAETLEHPAVSEAAAHPVPDGSESAANASEPTDHADPAAGEPAARPARKKGSRASVPSWDEIMFGGGPKE